MAAASRYAATTPALLNWFKAANSVREYAQQVKPFNFLLAFQARQSLELPDATQFVIRGRGRPRKQTTPRPIAPYDSKPSDGAKQAFDRETGELVPAQLPMTYAEALAQYHLRPEAKFLNGDFLDRGRTERRHVIATEIVHIGEEANRWEEQHFLGADEDAEIEYGSDQEAAFLDERIGAACREMGERKAAEALGISRAALRRALTCGCAGLWRASKDRVRIFLGRRDADELTLSVGAPDGISLKGGF
jgi:hypothetical protein